MFVNNSLYKFKNYQIESQENFKIVDSWTTPQLFTCIDEKNTNEGENVADIFIHRIFHSHNRSYVFISAREHRTQSSEQPIARKYTQKFKEMKTVYLFKYRVTIGVC